MTYFIQFCYELYSILWRTWPSLSICLFGHLVCIMYIVRQDVCFYENTRWIRTINTYENMQVYVIECSFILVKFIETRKKPESGHTVWAQYCTVICFSRITVQQPAQILWSLYFPGFGELDQNKRIFYNVNLHISA